MACCRKRGYRRHQTGTTARYARKKLRLLKVTTREQSCYYSLRTHPFSLRRLNDCRDFALGARSCARDVVGCRRVRCWCVRRWTEAPRFLRGPKFDDALFFLVLPQPIINPLFATCACGIGTYVPMYKHDAGVVLQSTAFTPYCIYMYGVL